MHCERLTVVRRSSSITPILIVPGANPKSSSIRTNSVLAKANAAAKKERQKLRKAQQQINRRRAERLGHLERQLAELKKLLQG